ncbi:hypothetical protein GCM10007871_14330 [Gluconobacter roseus NBRC 3990]|nr:hypothetical protein AA3990_1116 [Gluconobacter roseus NBRC 3990]GLP93455.1 hypothetical protein GCM10007871_14330 [Gluconobacter roseus NBRC 3990]
MIRSGGGGCEGQCRQSCGSGDVQKTGFHASDIALPAMFGKSEVRSGVHFGFVWNTHWEFLAVSNRAFDGAWNVIDGKRCGSWI